MNDATYKQLLDLVGSVGGLYDLEEVVQAVHHGIRPLIPCDVASICTSRVSDDLYDWYTTDCPSVFFEEYHTFAHADFVAAAVKQSPNTVLRDKDMLPRCVLESSVMYQRAHELGLPFEHAMSVLVGAPEGHGGITLYRTRPRPFDSQERVILQSVVRSIAQAISRSQRLRRVGRERDILSQYLASRGAELLVFRHRRTELFRTPGLDGVIRRWFDGSSLIRNSLPDLVEVWRRQIDAWPSDQAQGHLFRRTNASRSLDVSAELTPPIDHQVYLILAFSERPLHPALPRHLRNRLTDRQMAVVRGVLQGWENQLIAKQIKCAPNTVKKHMTNIMRRLDIDSRIQLIMLASEQGDDGD